MNIVHSLRLAALTEGVSLLVLLGIAMPLKYLAGMPFAVRVVGWVHGVLFLILLVLLAVVWIQKRWPLTRVAMVLIAALLPFGPFVIDRRLKNLE